MNCNCTARAKILWAAYQEESVSCTLLLFSVSLYSPPYLHVVRTELQRCCDGSNSLPTCAQNGQTEMRCKQRDHERAGRRHTERERERERDREKDSYHSQE